MDTIIVYIPIVLFLLENQFLSDYPSGKSIPKNQYIEIASVLLVKKIRQYQLFVAGFRNFCYPTNIIRYNFLNF